MRHPWSIARRVATAFVLLLGVVAVFSGWFAYVQARDTAYAVEERHVLGVASLVAREDLVVRAATSPDDAAELQQEIPALVERSRVSWMTLMDPQGLRLASWAPEQVGVRYPHPVDRAAAGGSWTEVSSSGTAGRSVRALVPVRDPADGRVVGVLTMGVQVSEVDILAAAQLPRLAVTFAVLLAAGVLASAVVARYLHRVTLGRGPEDLAEAFLLSEAAMDSVGAGILVLSPDGRIRQHNASAARSLGLPERGDDGTVAPDARLPSALAAALAGRAEPEFPLTLGERVYVVQQRLIPRAARRRGGAVDDAAREGVTTAPAGTRVVLLHDRTELHRLTDDLTTARTLTAALRAQTHEHANQLHTALSLLDTGRIAAARDVLSRHQRPSRDAADVVTALLEAKTAQAGRRGVQLDHRVRLDAPPPLRTLDLVSVVGNLVDNALDAAAARADPEDRWAEAEVVSDEHGLVVQVADGGAGPGSAGERIFEAGFTTKPAGPAGRGVGLALVRDIATAAGGVVDVATDSGTVFTVEVPPPRPARDDAERVDATTPRGGRS